jgi:putative ABC transport system permease protein
MNDPQQLPTPNAARAATWRRYLRFWGPRAEADVDDELAFHIEMRTRDLMERGMTEPDARAAVLRRLGNLAAARSECVAITSRRERRMTRAQLVDAFVQDVSYAWRTLGRQKGWTFVAAITLALGIGANTAVFSVVNTLLLHPLPYPDASRIVIMYQEPTKGNTTGMQVLVNPNAPTVRAWREAATSFETIQPYMREDRALRGTEGNLSIVHTASILPGFAALAGERPLVGRLFSDAETAGNERVAVLGEAFWRTRLGADPAIIGKPITLDQRPYTVIGVMRATFRLPRVGGEGTDVWLPLNLRDDNLGLSVVGRLRPGVRAVDAAKEMDRVANASTAPGAANPDFRTKLTPPSEMVRFKASLVMLWGAVGLVLLIACGNVAHLVLARTATRQRELAIRAALGASRLRLVRQLLTESLILSTAGFVGGLVAGWVGLQALKALRPDNLPELVAARIDGWTLFVTAALSVATGLAVGVVGAIQAGRHSAHDALKAGTLSASQSRRQSRFRSLLITSEMAVSMVLLVGAILLVRSMLHLQRLEPGFNAAGLYSVQIPLHKERYATPAARNTLATQLADRIRRLPSVEMVTITNGAPPSRSFMIGALQIEGDPDPAPGTTAFIDYNAIEANYFRAMGMRILQGSTITDTSKAAGQVVVNEGLVRKYWPGQSPLGRRLRVVYNGKGEWKTIVGVASNAFTGGLTSEAEVPTLYMSGGDLFQPTLLFRTRGGADPIPTVRAIITQLDPILPPATITNVDDAMQRSIAGPRFTMMLLVAFTVLALLLAAIGLYGVMAYSVAQRTREIGIRIALGATRRDVARSVMRQGALLAIVGAAIGLIGARWGSKVLEHMLYGVGRSDTVSFVLGAVVLIATALVACIVPMRRAVAVDPLVAIRAD